MSSPNRPLLADLKAELRGLKADVSEMLQSHWELARLEIQADLVHLKRLAFVWGAAAVMALTSLPLLATCVAETLDGWQGIARRGWLLIFGLSLLCTAVIGGYGAWFWFRRRFVGLEQTLEELREDLEWMKERMKDEG
jgi:uncharacterized membrane protein YqjE